MVSVSAEPPEVTWTHQRSCDVAIVPVDWEQGQEQATYLSRSSSVLSLRDDSAFQDKEREKKKKKSVVYRYLFILHFMQFCAHGITLKTL